MVGGSPQPEELYYKQAENHWVERDAQPNGPGRGVVQPFSVPQLQFPLQGDLTSCQNNRKSLSRRQAPCLAGTRLPDLSFSQHEIPGVIPISWAPLSQ